MGYRDYYVRKKNSIWSDNNALMMLIILNVAFFITLRFILAAYALSNLKQQDFYTNIFQWFSMPGDAKMFITRPWTIISSLFTEMDLWLMISNLFWLWSFGFIFQDLLGNSRIIPLYLYGGIGGALVYMLFHSLLPQYKFQTGSGFFYGSTTSLLAIVSGATVFAPNYKLFPMIRGGISLWIISLIFGVIDLSFIASRPDLIFAHLGSILIGFLFVIQLKNGHDWGKWMNDAYFKVIHLFTPKTKKPVRKRIREEVFYNTGGKIPFSRKSNLSQQRVDEILDKINLKGYDQLTQEEKDILNRASNEEL
ncbi:MAG: rhomboid family intramembrane serine protease [Chitinophagaceae bacterium]